MEQLIKITTVPIEYEFKVNDAKLERRRGSAELEISRNDGGMTIRSRPIKLNMDTYDARASVMGPTPTASTYEEAQKGQQAAYQATAQFAQEGKMMLYGKIGQGAENLQNIAVQRNAKPTGQFELGFTPTTGPNIEWEPADFSIEYQMDRLNFDAKIEQGQIEFIPGSIEMSITQHPDVHVEYVGDPIYVPPRAAEFFHGQVVDVQA